MHDHAKELDAEHEYEEEEKDEGEGLYLGGADAARPAVRGEM